MSQPHIPHAPHTPKLGAASTAIVAIVTANPGISTQQIHAEMRLHRPRITYSLSRPNSLAKHRHIVNVGSSSSGMARWYAASMVPRPPKPAADPHHAAPPDPLAYPDSAWIVNCYYGNTSADGKTFNDFVRLVRSGQ